MTREESHEWLIANGWSRSERNKGSWYPQGYMQPKRISLPAISEYEDGFGVSVYERHDTPQEALISWFKVQRKDILSRNHHHSAQSKLLCNALGYNPLEREEIK